MTLDHDLLARVRADTALIGVSGGRDSVGLLHALVMLGKPKLILCHLNHSLRGRESGRDAAFVRSLARRYRLVCEVEKIDVAALAKTRAISIESAAREARHEFLHRLAAKHHTPFVFLAHHADDQAETILANLCRGAGLGGLGGMRPDARMGGLHLIRPLLSTSRGEIDAYVAAHGLKFREDSSNVSPEHRRNRLRHEVLPLLGQIYERDVAPIIVRCGQQAARDVAYLESAALGFIKMPGRIAADGALNIDHELRALPAAMLSRVLRLWLLTTRALPGIDEAVTDAAISMLQPQGPAKINLPLGRHLRRKARRLWVE